MANRAYVVVEGHGEVRAVGNLLSRLGAELSLPFVWGDPIRVKGLHARDVVHRMAERLRVRGDCGAMLLLRDEDDACPARVGPEIARWLSEARLPFPAAAVLAHREYESLFLCCLSALAGKPLRDDRGVVRPGIQEGATFDGDPQGIRDAKGWLSKTFPPGRIYKPTEDQLPLTRMLDFDMIRASGLPWFGTLERALRFLVSASAGQVYP
jgi:hypothetical protein